MKGEMNNWDELAIAQKIFVNNLLLKKSINREIKYWACTIIANIFIAMTILSKDIPILLFGTALSLFWIIFAWSNL